MITTGVLVHRRRVEPVTKTYQLEFVDRGFYDGWMQSQTITPVGMAYNRKDGYGYVWDDHEGTKHESQANIVVFYTDEEGRQHITKLRIDDDVRVLIWLDQLSRQPKDFEGPGRPPKRWLEMSNYTQRGRR